MKRIILYLLLLVSLPVFSQKIDYYNFDTTTFVNEFVRSLNEYRTSKGLDTVVLGGDKWSHMSNYHSRYMAKRRKISHDQFTPRIKHYGINVHAENVTTINITKKFCGEDYFTYEYLAKKVLQRWINSNDHNWNMLRRDTKIVYLGTNIVMDIIPKGVINDPTKPAYQQNVKSMIYCTLIMGDAGRVGGWSKSN